jgi:hypothetical protein
MNADKILQMNVLREWERLTRQVNRPVCGTISASAFICVDLRFNEVPSLKNISKLVA